MNNNIDLIIKEIDNLINNKNNTIIKVAIDGYCTSGKTTLSEFLSQRYNCNVFHMDDFFLRQEQRTNDRLNEIGGNIDYERFNTEVLIPLKNENDFSYKPYDCHNGSFKKTVNVISKRLNIIEGSYSMHPYFTCNYDLRIFLNISPELQKIRILKRNKSLHQNFFNKWIPMENQYFKEYNISQNSDIIINDLQLAL